MTNSNHHTNFHYAHFLVVCLVVFSHMNNICVVVFTHIDPLGQWQHNVNMKNDLSMKKAHGCGSSIQTPLSSPLWTIGWMRPIVMGDWWVGKNETASILTSNLYQDREVIELIENHLKHLHDISTTMMWCTADREIQVYWTKIHKFSQISKISHQRQYQHVSWFTNNTLDLP